MSAFLQACFVECPSPRQHLVVETDHHVESHPVLNLVVAGDDVFEDVVDRICLGFGEESDAAEIDSQNGDFGVTRQVGGPQERPVAAEDQNQFAALGIVIAAVDNLDDSPGGTQFRGIELQWSAVEGLGH